MTTQSKWVLEDKTKNQIVRSSTIKPRIDYATEIVDQMLCILTQKKMELNKTTLMLYNEYDDESRILLEIKLKNEFEILYSVESLRQVKRHLDSVVGLGNVPTVLIPTISIVRVTRSRMLSFMPPLDFYLGELSLLLGGVVIDAAHLAGSILDFAEANKDSKRLLDEAKLIANSKMCKQFPNVDFL